MSHTSDSVTLALMQAQAVLIILKECVDAPWNRVQSWSWSQVLLPILILIIGSMTVVVFTAVFLLLVRGAKAMHERATTVED